MLGTLWLMLVLRAGIFCKRRHFRELLEAWAAHALATGRRNPRVHGLCADPDSDDQLESMRCHRLEQLAEVAPLQKIPARRRINAQGAEQH